MLSRSPLPHLPRGAPTNLSVPLLSGSSVVALIKSTEVSLATP
ncbi:hypothetical protein ACFZAR_14870 [Streptomyces sp. NPDC008222]